MNIERTLLASALLLAFQPAVRAADDQQTINDGKIQQVVVTASPLRNGEGDQILTPAALASTDRKTPPLLMRSS